MRYYTVGKDGIVGLLQLAGDQLKNVWNKFAKGAPREEIVAQYGEDVVQLAEEPMEDGAKWAKISAAWGEVGHGTI